MLGLILLFPLGFVVWLCLFRDTPLEISKETTLITEPLTADGTRVDYFRAIELELYPPNMKTDDNGYRLLVRALGPMVDSSSSDAAILAEQTYEKLGLDPTIKPTLTYEEPSDFLQRYEAAKEIKETEEETTGTENLDDLDLSPTPEEEYEAVEDIDEQLSRPWTLETMPMMADWLEQNGPTLDLLAEAVRKPVFCRPWTRSDEEAGLLLATPLSDIQRFRSFARGLFARANYRIATGDIDGAINDLITCKVLGCQVGKQGTVIDAVVGISLEGIANSIPIAGSLEHQPTEAQLERLSKELENLPKRSTPETSLLFERYYMLDMVQLLATRNKEKMNLEDIFWNVAESDQIVLKASNVLGFNWNTVLNRFNIYFNDPSKLDSIQRRIGVSSKSYWLSLGVLLPTSRSEILADYLAANHFSSDQAIREAFHRLECSDRVRKITLAMLLYEKQHGRLPPAYTIDADGKPLHSWRVLLLPYLGEEAKKLHSQIKLDEPWDSQHNSQFHDAAVSFYQCPSADLKPGQTIYSVVVDKKTAFQPGEGKTLDQFGPNSEYLILVLEGDNVVCWMDPLSDMTEKVALHAIRSHKLTIHPGVFFAGFRNGSTTTISFDLSDRIFQDLLEGIPTDWPD